MAVAYSGRHQKFEPKTSIFVHPELRETAPNKTKYDNNVDIYIYIYSYIQNICIKFENIYTFGRQRGPKYCISSDVSLNGFHLILLSVC